MADEINALSEINKADLALESASNIHEMLVLRDKAAATQVFADAQGFRDVAQKAKIFQLKAERKAGRWLEDNVKKGRPKKMFQDETFLPDGVSRLESHRWQLEASVPDERFNNWVDESISTGAEVSASGLIRLAKDINRKNQISEIKTDGITPPTGLFDVIVIDPPWPYGTEYDASGRRAASPYPEMSLEDIKEIDLPTAEDCVLWLWTTHKFMRDSFEILDYWGFRDVAILTWVKNRMGLGAWLRSRSEFCIMAVKGKPKVNLTNQTTVLFGDLREHSRKPDEFFEMVNELCPGYKLEWFSREKRDGWEAFGNEPEKF